MHILAAQATIAYAQGEHREALRLMHAAEDKEDTSEKSSVNPWRLIHARELLGDMLLRGGQPTEALAAYEQSMMRDPRRFHSLAGAASAAAWAGDAARAANTVFNLSTWPATATLGRRLTAARAYLAGR